MQPLCNSTNERAANGRTCMLPISRLKGDCCLCSWTSPSLWSQRPLPPIYACTPPRTEAGVERRRNGDARSANGGDPVKAGGAEDLQAHQVVRVGVHGNLGEDLQGVHQPAPSRQAGAGGSFRRSQWLGQ